MSAISTPQVRPRVSILAAAAIALVGMLGGCQRAISDKDRQPISLAEVRALTQSDRPDVVLLIDPRSPAAFARGHLPGARNLSLEAIDDRFGTTPELERYANLVVYGDDPGTGVGRAMAKRLMSVGYKSVRLFFGGVSEWRRAGLELETSEPVAEN